MFGQVSGKEVTCTEIANGICANHIQLLICVQDKLSECSQKGFQRTVQETGNRGDISVEFTESCFQQAETLFECVYINDDCKMVAFDVFVVYCII